MRADLPLVVISLLCACGSMRGRAAVASVQTGVSDAQTTARGKSALLNDADIGARPITIQVVQGIVELSGRVRSAAEVERASALARGVDGVQNVRERSPDRRHPHDAGSDRPRRRAAR